MVKRSSKKFKEEQAGVVENYGDGTGIAIKLELAFVQTMTRPF